VRGPETRLVDFHNTCWTEFWNTSRTPAIGVSRRRRSRAQWELTLIDLPRLSKQRPARPFKHTSTNRPFQQKSERSGLSPFVRSPCKLEGWLKQLAYQLHRGIADASFRASA